MKTYAWPNDAQLALSIVVNVEEGAESTIADGDRGPEPVDELGIVLKKPMRNFGNESNYRYGIKAGAPRVMRLLERYKIRATFTAAALALERAPELAAEIVAQGHEVCSHGYKWAHQFHMKEADEREFIRKAVASIQTTTGARPVGWLSRYLLTENTRRLLQEEGFLY
ncbi:MAG: polysaccharide deacetylase family protein, partial [Burkholderiales bacterium]